MTKQAPSIKGLIPSYNIGYVRKYINLIDEEVLEMKKLINKICTTYERWERKKTKANTI